MDGTCCINKTRYFCIDSNLLISHKTFTVSGLSILILFSWTGQQQFYLSVWLIPFLYYDSIIVLYNILFYNINNWRNQSFYPVRRDAYVNDSNPNLKVWRNIQSEQQIIIDLLPLYSSIIVLSNKIFIFGDPFLILKRIMSYTDRFVQYSNA